MGGGDVDLGVEPLAGAAQPGDLERDHQRVGDRGARLKAAGKRNHRDPLGARGSASLPPVVATIRRAPSAPAASYTARVSSVLPE